MASSEADEMGGERGESWERDADNAQIDMANRRFGWRLAIERINKRRNGDLFLETVAMEQRTFA